MEPDVQRKSTPTLRLTGIGLLSVGVAVALFIAGRVQSPNYYFTLFGSTNPLGLKSMLATIALGLAVVQVVLALWIYRKLPLAGVPPRPVPITHRVVGFVLIAVTLPIAIHCMIAYGVNLSTPRQAIHSVAGCFFYGAFVAKVLLVQTKRLPNWVLPVAGGLLAIVLGVLWYTSALYYYNGFQLPQL